jgi:tellurite methyltransferase
MLRKIVGFKKDDEPSAHKELDWTAELDCYHLQHVRHKPPFFNRPWVETSAGRLAKIGAELDCLRCDQFEWPAGLTSYKKTPEFTADSVPRGLLKEHSLKIGTWGLLMVSAAEVTFHVASMGFTKRLAPGSEQVIVPELLHHIEPGTDAVFQIEFYRRQDS